MEKSAVEKLIKSNSDRVQFERSNGTSDVWPSFVLINVDEEFSNFSILHCTFSIGAGNCCGNGNEAAVMGREWK
jgi:hypothetical protein